MVMGCNIIQEVKGLTKKLYFVLQSRRKTSFYAKFQVHCYMVVAFIIMYCQVSKTGSKRTNYVTVHYPGRKPVY